VRKVVRRIVVLVVLVMVIAASLAIMPSPASADRPCPEGRPQFISHPQPSPGGPPFVEEFICVPTGPPL
jgi:hypothetical protein